MDISLLTDAIEDECTPLVRTDFSDDAAWAAVVRATTSAVIDPEDDEPMGADVVVIEDRAFLGLIATALGEQVAQAGNVLGYALLADQQSMTEAAAGGEVTVQYVDLSVRDEEDAEVFDSFPGNSFRCEVGEVASIEANLVISNMDFAEFAGAVQKDGVFRGFDG